MTASVTAFQLVIDSGRRPSSSRILKASVVNPSPQHLSRGKAALSRIVTSSPRRHNSIAEAQPAGPAPTIITSVER